MGILTKTKTKTKTKTTSKPGSPQVSLLGGTPAPTTVLAPGSRNTAAFCELEDRAPSFPATDSATMRWSVRQTSTRPTR